MEFDWEKIPTLYHALNNKMKFLLVTFGQDDIVVHTKNRNMKSDELRRYYSFDFRPTGGGKDI